MRKASKFSTGIIAFAIVLVCSPFAWSQSAAPTTRSNSTGVGSGTSASGTQVVKTSKSSEATSMNALKAYKQSHPGADENDLQYLLLKTRADLEVGQANQSLNADQVQTYKAKIADIEYMQKNGKPMGDVSPNGGAPTIAVKNILAAKKANRAQILALSEPEQRQVLRNVQNITISDLVNASNESMQRRLPNVNYISIDNFMNNTDVVKMAYILKNPSSYVIVKDDSMIPKQQMTRAQFNSLPSERREAVVASHKVEIID
jgi:hypothetical protein